MSNSKKRNLATKNVAKRQNNSPLIRLINRSEPEDLHVKFTHFDGSTRSMPVNTDFVKNEKGGKLSSFEIVKKLNTLQHDFNAESYEVTNLSI